MVFTKDQKVEFGRLYEIAISADDMRLVQLKDNMLKLMVDGGEARIKFMHPKTVVPHPKNRGGSKMQVGKIYLKGSNIITVGVSLDECGPNKAVAFEVNPLDKKIANDFIKLCATSDHYASYTDAGAIGAGSVGSGHWNQFLASIVDKARVPKQFVSKLCEPGREHLDGERLCRDQPALRKLLDHGLQFTVIKYSMETEYPQLPNILQKALNVEHHIGEGVCACIYIVLSKLIIV